MHALIRIHQRTGPVYVSVCFDSNFDLYQFKATTRPDTEREKQ